MQPESQPTVQNLVEEAIRLAGRGHSQDGVRSVLIEQMGTTLDTEEISEKLNLLNAALQHDSRWTKYQTASPPEATAGNQPASNDPTSQPLGADDIRLLLLSLQQDLAKLTQENQELQKKQAQPYPSPIITTERRTIKIPDPEPFDGRRRDFARWKLQMEGKLAHDGAALGSPTQYIFNRTKGNAALVAMAWMRQTPEGTEDMMWSFLEEHFGNRLEAEQSRQRLLSTLR